MTSGTVNSIVDDDLDGYEYFHPVEVLGFWLSEIFDRVFKPRFLDPPPKGVALSEEEDQAKYGPIDTTEDWKPWGERHALTLNEAEHALGAVVGVNRWLHYGLGERAGTIETALRERLPDLVDFLKRTNDADQFRERHRQFLEIAGPIYDTYQELCPVAINPYDGALEEWFKIIEAMRSGLDEFLKCHGLLHQLVFPKRRGRIGDLMYRYLKSMGDFEILLPAVEPQIRRGYRGDEEYDRAVEVLRLSARARWSFEAVLTNNNWGDASIPADTHEGLRYEATRVLRKLEATLAGRPRPGQPRVMWKWKIEDSPIVRPNWDKERRELRFGDATCKRYTRPAKKQWAVLDAFQEENWPPRIDDPLLGKLRYEAVRQLNSGLKLIRFTNDGGGDGICWALVRRPK